MRRILLPLLLLISVAAVAQTTCDELVPKLMEVTGTNQALAVTPAIMQGAAAVLLNKEGSMRVDTKHALQAVLSNGLNVERLSKNIQRKLMSSCDPSLYAASLEKLQSPLGQKMREMELRPISSPEEGKRMQRYLSTWEMQSPRDSRMQVIRRLLRTTGATDTYVDQIMEIRTVMLEAGLQTYLPKEQLAVFRQELMPRVQEAMEAQMYYLYRGATDEELEQYITLQATKPMQRLTQDEARALLYGFSQEMVEFATKVRKVVLDQKAKQEGE